ncbi:alpha/beta hydrolase family protein [Paenibacillus donghaensis]|uniref:Carboxylic ester hydrolase n=1 Tax=Paenibacillus donghaensis TaxID=414771 RepID=A0A2Z2KKG8_9BACL|nr:hypothetical protein [Paenibacillus donghaensis]ASA21482.1 hypothetical protein B9T62_12250 [Paenibacillus donghaensis]
MRVMEWVLLVLSFAMLGGLLILPLRSRMQVRLSLIAALIAVIMSVIQVWMEGYRWQMIPAYAVALLLIVRVIVMKSRGSERYIGQHRSRLRIIMNMVLFMFYLGVATALPILLPVFSFAAPSGPYAVGTSTYYWVDENRSETYTADPADNRQLMVQLWYPAELEGDGRDKSAPYIEHLEEIAQGLQDSLNMPRVMFSQLSEIETHAYRDAKVSSAEKKYPVLLFSHGLTGFRNQNTFQAEELASQGYIVAGIDHAYGAAAVVYPGGETAKLQLPEDSGFAAYEATMKIWVEDASFVLDKLERLAASGKPAEDVASRLDLEQIGMYGHSFGGATAAQMLMQDSRIKAALNMDGTLYGPDIPEQGLGKPYLQMNGEQSIDKAAFDTTLDEAVRVSGRTRDSFEQFWQESAQRREHAIAGGGYSLVLANTDHMSFTDFYLFSPLLPPKGAAAERIQEEINRLSLAFFDQTLKQSAERTVVELAEELSGVTLEQGK